MRKSGSIRLVLALASIAVLGATLPAMAKAPSGSSTGCSGNSGTSFNVTSIISDTDSNSLPFQLQSDGEGAYTTYQEF